MDEGGHWYALITETVGVDVETHVCREAGRSCESLDRRQ